MIISMIASLKGTITEKFADNSIVLEVAGVGYAVTVPQGDYENLTLDNQLKLYTYHHLREQSEDLYGFSTLEAKKLFELLLGVQGIGPKAAIAILSLAPAENIRSAIAASDASFIAKATGVGKKSAERVIVDLHDKVGFTTANYKSIATTPTEKDDALEALISLGYNLATATTMLEKVDKSLPLEQRITEALKY